MVITTNTSLRTQVKKPAVSEKAEEFLRAVLTKDPETRQGANEKQEIKDDPFFADIDWKRVMDRDYEAPIVEDEDIEHYNRRLKLNDADYTKENWKKLRIANFTFVRESELEP